MGDNSYRTASDEEGCGAVLAAIRWQHFGEGHADFVQTGNPKKDNFRRLTGEALEEQIADTVKALREGKSVIANCTLARGVGMTEDANGRFTIHPWPALDSPDRPMMRNLFPAPRTETAGWPNAALLPNDEDVEATMRLSKAVGEIRQRLLDPKSGFNVLLEKNRELEAARKAKSQETPHGR